MNINTFIGFTVLAAATAAGVLYIGSWVAQPEVDFFTALSNETSLISK
jgi:hypothetical protein